MALDIATLTSFFGWCSVLNGALLVFWSVMWIAIPDTVYRLQSRFVEIPRETYNVVMYGLVGGFKLLWFTFNVVPWIALKVVACCS